MSCRYFTQGGKELAGDELKDYMKGLSHEKKLKLAPEIAKDSYASISWTPGQAQADRYDLSKQVDRLQYYPNRKQLVGHDKNGKKVVDELPVEPSKLADYIGKEAAEKLLKAPVETRFGPGPASDYHLLEGADLKVGGEFHKRLYDETWVNKANAIAKKFGSKVDYSKHKPLDAAEREERHEIYMLPEKVRTVEQQKRMRELDARSDMEELVDRKNVKSIPFLRITPALRDAALQKGFALFADSGRAGAPLTALTRVNHDPFKLAELEKQHGVSLTPVEHNPFTVDTYHGTGGFKGTEIEPKMSVDIHHDISSGIDEYRVWDQVNKHYMSPVLKTKADAEKWIQTKVGSEFFSAANPELGSGYAEFTAKPAVLPLKLDIRDYHTFDAAGKPWQSANSDAIYEANQLGKKGVIIKNVRDNPTDLNDIRAGLGKDHGPQTVYITLDPSTVRSRFAKFDPAKFGESGLLKAAGLPLPMQEHLYNLQNYISTIEDAPADQQQKLLQKYMTHWPDEKPASVGISGKTAALGAAKAAEWLAFLGSRNYPKINGPMTAAWVAQWPVMGHMLKNDVKKQLKAGVKPEDIEFKPGSVGDLFGMVSSLRAKFGAKADSLQPVEGDPFERK